MKFMKHSRTMLLAVGMMAMVLTACGSQETKKPEDTTTIADTADTEKETTVADTTDTEETRVADTADTEETTTTEDSNDAATITEEEAINLVKAEMGDDFSYVPADELEERDGSQYYVIYVEMLLDTGNMTTVATYMVKTDGSEYFDKDAVNYTGEYVQTGDVGEVTFVVSEDGTFEMITDGVVNQVISGSYKFGITDSASVVELLLYPQKCVIDGKEEVMEDVEGTAVIEGDKLTLRMESEDTVFTKK